MRNPRLDILITSIGTVKVAGNDVPFADVIERGNDLREVFKAFKDDVSDPDTYANDRFDGGDSPPIKNDPGYRKHVRPGVTKRKFKVTSTRPFLPRTKDSWEDEVVNAVADFLVSGKLP